MGYANLLLRPDLGKKAYRLRCRFTVPAFPRKDWLDKAKVTAAEAFVRDMAKQGFEYVDKYGFEMTGPFAPLVRGSLPKRHEQERWHQSSREMLPGLMRGVAPRASGGGYVSVVPSLNETEQWDYELKGVFVHKTILVEQPDSHELEKELVRR